MDMKCWKMLGLMALSLMALLAAFAGSASATELTSPKGTVYNGTVSAESENGITFDGPFKVSCENSTWEAEVEKQGSAVTVSGKFTNITYTECNQATITVINPGTFEIHTDNTVNANGNGIITSMGLEITTLLHYPFFGTIHCITETNNNPIGTIEGSINTGGTAKTESLPILDPTDSICSEQVGLTGNYKITNPDYLDID
jgi:hypothetical protein